MEGTVEQSRAGAERSVWKLTRDKRMTSEREPADGRGWPGERGSHTERSQSRTCDKDEE